MRRLERRQPVRRHADQRRVHRLMLPALRRQRQPRRRGDQQEPRILVAGVDQRIEAAVDERVVHRPDRQHPRPGHPRRQAGRTQQQEQVLLRDPQLDVLALRRHAPALRRRQLGIAEHVVAGMAVEDAAPVHPWPEVGGHRHVRRRRHDMRGQLLQLALPAADLRQDLAEAALRGHLPPGQPGHRQRRPAPAPPARTAAAPPASVWCRTGNRAGTPAVRPPARPAPRTDPIRGRGGCPCSCRNSSICSLVISPAWLSLWPANGRPMPLIV